MKSLIQFEGAEWVRLTSLQALRAFPKEKLLIAEMIQRDTGRGIILEVHDSNYVYVTRGYKNVQRDATNIEARKYGDVKQLIRPTNGGEIWMLKQIAKPTGIK